MNIYIILINYNGMKDTIACIESISKSNRFESIHIVVVDNASQDQSGNSLFETYAGVDKVSVLLQKENLGFSGGNNIGARYALGKGATHIMFLNNDTVVEPDFLDEIVEYYDSNANIGLITGKIYYYSMPDTFWYAGGTYSDWKGRAGHIGFQEKDCGQYDEVTDIKFCCGCYVLMSSEKYMQFGPMSEQYFLYSEDLDYSIRVLSMDYRIVYYPQSRIYHKVNAATGTASPLTSYYVTRNTLIFIKENIHGLKKITAYMFAFYGFIKKVCFSHYSLKATTKGILDFLKRKKGRRDALI